MCIEAQDVRRAVEIEYRNPPKVTQEEYDFMKSQGYPVQYMNFEIIG